MGYWCAFCEIKDGPTACGAEGPQHYHCTRSLGHSGSHVACAMTSHAIEIWGGGREAQLESALRAMVETLDPDERWPTWVYRTIPRGFGCRLCVKWLPWADSWDEIEHAEDCPIAQARALLDRGS